MTKKEAWAIVCGLSKPAKMPCPSYGLPASKCITGWILSQEPGTVCWKCYATRGQYQFKNVQLAQHKRLLSISDPRWVTAMTILIRGMDFFRWHDSGDLQSLTHYNKICLVALLTPMTLHWLPTKEKRYLSLKRPPNLIVRYSLTKIDQSRGPRVPPHYYTSGVVTDGTHTCPASETIGGNCDMFNCRKCWDTSVKHVTYKLH